MTDEDPTCINCRAPLSAHDYDNACPWTDDNTPEEAEADA